MRVPKNPGRRKAAAARKHRWPAGALLLVLLAAALAGCSTAAGGDDEPRAAMGEIDLRGVPLKEEIVALAGKWAFYPEVLLTPGAAWASLDAEHVPVPQSWNGYDTLDSFDKGQGFGTYRLTIVTKRDGEILSLRIPNISSAYRLWIDGRLMAEAGTVGPNKALSEPGAMPQTVSFANDAARHELIVQVSNFDHRRGGIWLDFELGGSTAMDRYQSRTTAERMIIFGSLFMVGFYHLGLFALRRQERFTLYFGLLCLFVAARIIVMGDAFLMQWLPQLSWEAGLKVEYGAFALAALSGYLYIYHLFPKDASRRMLRAVAGVSGALCLLVLLTPPAFFSKLLGLFQLFVAVISLYAIAVLIRARRRRRDGAALVLTGFTVFVLTILNDMSFYNEWFGVDELVPIGLFFVIMMQSFIISYRFSRALRKVEQVTEEVRELNLGLESKVAERTEALQLTNANLAEAYAELEKLETSRRRLLSNISHDLRTPMTLVQGYLEALKDEVVEDPRQQQTYIRMMLSKVNGLNRLIHDLFELSKLEAGQVALERRRLSLSEWMAIQEESWRLDAESKGFAFEIAFVPGPEGTSAEQVWLELDEFKMGRVMANLVSNALGHMQPGGRLKLTFYRDEEAGTVVTEIGDTGSGIEAGDLPYIFDRFYMREKSKRTTTGSGLGLAIAKEIVEAHGGTISAASEPGKGSVFRIELPAAREH
ncbi:sensor histidine kinase [Paenibacillus sp. IB182496]|uniref:histidine kinase n=1 Tax=Paenibacillus sabuli TaxID=2772509 RepID=A0A927GTC7_9BACL|nr:sensor histidine kinase [Paenibacillus sabuli]MBD2846960.1 sensor histidine kinase [Paenibacillus sabuli]